MLRIVIAVVVIQGSYCLEKNIWPPSKLGGEGGRRTGRVDLVESLRSQLMKDNYDYEDKRLSYKQKEVQDMPPLLRSDSHNIKPFNPKEQKSFIQKETYDQKHSSQRRDAYEMQFAPISAQHGKAHHPVVHLANIMSDELKAPRGPHYWHHMKAFQQTKDKPTSSATTPQPRPDRLKLYHEAQPELPKLVDGRRLLNNDVSVDVNSVEHSAGDSVVSANSAVASLSGEAVLSYSPPTKPSLASSTGVSIKYKILKVRGGGGRRSGMRQVLEERGPDRVALVPLDHGSVPFVRLSSGRRQYMHDRADLRPPLADAFQRHRRRLVSKYSTSVPTY